MSDQIPEPPPASAEKKGLLSRATDVAKSGIDKTKEASAQRQAARTAEEETRAAAAAAGMEALIETGHLLMEYRVVSVRESIVGDKIDTNKVQTLLNEWAQAGWHVRAITSASVGGRVGPGGVDGLIVTFERPVLH